MGAISISFGSEAQRCAAPLPVGETGGSKGRGDGRGGGSPGLHEAEGAEGRGYPGRRRATARAPFPTRGVVPLRAAAPPPRQNTTACREAAAAAGTRRRRSGGAAGALAPRPQERPEGVGSRVA